MVKLEVKNGRIATRILPEKIPVYEEVREGVANLLAEFQAEAICLGNNPEHVKSAFNEMVSVILSNNDRLVKEKLIQKGIIIK